MNNTSRIAIIALMLTLLVPTTSHATWKHSGVSGYGHHGTSGDHQGTSGGHRH